MIKFHSSSLIAASAMAFTVLSLNAYCFENADPKPAPGPAPVAAVATVPSPAPAGGHGLKVTSRDFDKEFVDNAREACRNLQGAPEADFDEWLASELKDVHVTAPKPELVKIQIWQSRIDELKFGKDEIQGALAARSPGTFGSINREALANSNDSSGRKLSAPVVDAGRGIADDFKNVNAEKKFAVIERSDALPDLLAAVLEAKAHKAVGVISYEKKSLFGFKKTSQKISDAIVFPIPLILVSEETAQDILKKNKQDSSLTVSLTAKTEFPVAVDQTRVAIKEGDRPLSVSVEVSHHGCPELAAALGLLEWIDRSGEAVKGSQFTFVSDKSDVPGSSDEGTVKFSLNVSEPLNGKKIISDFVKADLSPENLIDWKPVVQAAAALPNKLKGFVDADELHRYTEKMNSLKKVKVQDALALYKLRKAYEPYLAQDGQDLLSRMAVDLKTLEDMHAAAQRGLWDQSAALSRKIYDFDWATNVSAETYAEYRKLHGDSGDEVDPAIWLQVQKGRKGVDGLLDLLEKEIDRLGGKLSENFSKLQKAMDSAGIMQTAVKQ
jgi:hypothetical protein